MTKNYLFRVEPLPGKDNTECAVVATSEDGENWSPIPMSFPSRSDAEKFIDMALEGMKRIQEYQEENPPYIYPKKHLH